MKEVIGWLREVSNLLSQQSFRSIRESDQRFATAYLATNGRWYTGLARSSYNPEITWFGPFASKEAAIGEFDFHSNPGSFMVDDSGTKSPPETLERPTKETPGETSW